MKIELSDETRDFLLEHVRLQRKKLQDRIDEGHTASGLQALEKIKEHWDDIHSAIINAG